MLDRVITAAILIVIKILEFFDVQELLSSLVRLVVAAVTLLATLLAHLFENLKRSLKQQA
jgi:hypothetical protein